MTLDVDRLTYSYRDHLVLDGATVSIRPGEILGILGPNGCGKTTMLKNLNRNLSPEAGAILLDGTDLEDISKKEIARSIATVPQANEIRFSFTIREIVAMGRMPFQKSFQGESSEDIQMVDEALKDTSLWEIRDRPVNEVSGGERQRAIIARALVQTPKYLLMDEPTNHLDINMQFEVLDLVRDLSRKNGISVVMVSHNLPMAARYCDRIALIKDHKVMCCGTPEEVLTTENMRDVFFVDADLGIDEKTGSYTVNLHGSARSKKE